MRLSRIVDDRFHLVLKKLSEAPLPLRTAFRLKGISKIVREEYSKYDECRKTALLKYGLKNEDGTLQIDEHQNVKFDGPGIAAFSRELNDLASVEVEVPNIKLEELGNDVILSVSELELLEDIILE